MEASEEGNDIVITRNQSRRENMCAADAHINGLFPRFGSSRVCFTFLRFNAMRANRRVLSDWLLLLAIANFRRARKIKRALSGEAAKQNH